MCGWFFSSLLALVGIAVLGLIRDRWKRKKRENTRNQFRFFLAAGVLFSAAILIFPIQLERLEKTNTYGFQAAVSSFVYAMQLFTLNVEYKELPWFVESFRQADWAAAACTVLLTAEFVAAPLLTFTIALSFFRNVYAWFRRIVLFRQDTHVFSEMNERSLVLAESIHKDDRKACLIFTDVKTDEENMPEYMINRARKIKAVWYKQDILSVNLSRCSKKRQLTLYLIKNEKETENIVQAMELIERFKDRENCKLYVFTSRSECEYLLNKKEGQRIVARRINDVSSLVNQTLFENGCGMLYGAATNGHPRKISVVLIGLGRHGMEMLKALTWYCQMYGYKLEINAFDKNPNVLRELNLTCKELFENQDFLGNLPGHEYDPGYQIHIYPGTDTESAEFLHKLEDIGDPGYILVALGDDEYNIRTAVNIRMICERMAAERMKDQPTGKEQAASDAEWEEGKKPLKHPKIQAIVYNSKECRILKDLANFRGQEYEIEFIGDVESSFTQDVLINSELEQVAKEVHKDYNNGSEEGFHDFEYNYRSSCASAIHIRAIASQMLEIEMDEKLLEKMEFWLKLTYRLLSTKLEEQGKTDNLKKMAGPDLLNWAAKMSGIVDKLAMTKEFSFTGWNELPKSNGELNELRKRSEEKPKDISEEGFTDAAKQVLIWDQMCVQLGGLLEEYRDLINIFSNMEKKVSDADYELIKEIPYTRSAILHSVIHVKNEDEKEQEEAWELEKIVAYLLLTVKLMELEHIRWLAYMRTEGYRFAKQKNDLGKMHPDLCAMKDLDEGEKGKDLHVRLLMEQQRVLKKKMKEKTDKDEGKTGK